MQHSLTSSSRPEVVFIDCSKTKSDWMLWVAHINCSLHLLIDYVYHAVCYIIYLSIQYQSMYHLWKTSFNAGKLQCNEGKPGAEPNVLIKIVREILVSD